MIRFSTLRRCLAVLLLTLFSQGALSAQSPEPAIPGQPAKAELNAPEQAPAPATQAPPAPTPGTPPATTKATPPVATPLVWWNREITVFRSLTTQLTPEARSADALEQISAAAEQLLSEPVTAEPAEIDGETATRFLVGETYLFSLLGSDLDSLSGQNLQEETDKIIASLEEIRLARIEQGSAGAVVKGLVAAVIATVIFIVAIFVLRILSSRISNFTERQISKWKRLRLARADLRPHFGLLGKQFIRVVAFLAGTYLFCIWVAFVFHQFPLTEPLGSAFTDRLLAFGKGLLSTASAAVPGLITACIILLVTHWLARLIDRVVRSMGDNSNKGVMANDTAKATRRILVAMVWILGVVLAYPYLPGSGSDAFKGISVLLGLMVSLGSSGMINQVMSGFVLLYSGSVRTGEYIKLGEIEGTITEMGILAVKLLTPSREFLTIPNAVMITNPTTNYSRLRKETGVPITTIVTIGYDAPWRQVHKLLIGAATDTKGMVDKPEPKVIQKALSDWYAEYTLVGYAADPKKRTRILSELNGRVQDAFNEAGIQIMSPHYKDDPPEPMVIPKDKWFPGNHDAPGPPKS